ncbi:unnamed protein product [Ceratitis capitata]|uniref:(Mediterranean fruit fly) hypothetical protein n=1 Tax=Ceratitis capitata TaxID=7213 RepID=A0A811UR33_CERCA|nr:unnamed protein product [Ceratitis capitata]
MTVTPACSPCSANYMKTINALKYRKKVRGPVRAVKSFLNYHFVVDYVGSFATEDEAIGIAEQVREIHMRSKPSLRNFLSNSSGVTEALGGNGTARQISKKEGVLVKECST